MSDTIKGAVIGAGGAIIAAIITAVAAGPSLLSGYATDKIVGLEKQIQILQKDNEDLKSGNDISACDNTDTTTEARCSDIQKKYDKLLTNYNDLKTNNESLRNNVCVSTASSKKLIDLVPSGKKPDDINRLVEDYSQNQHPECVIFSGDCTSTPSFYAYPIGSKYTTFTGKLVAQRKEHTSFSMEKVTMTVYFKNNDDTIGETYVVSYVGEPVEFSINVTGVDVLKMYFVNESALDAFKICISQGEFK